jgi:capsular polysaccharide biosynthesis protein
MKLPRLPFSWPRQFPISHHADPAIHRLAAADRSVAPAPMFMFGPANAEVHDEIYGQLETGPVECAALPLASVTAAGAVEPHAGTQASPDGPWRRIPGSIALLRGPIPPDFGHWLVDVMPRLWVLHASGYDLKTLQFLVPGGLPPEAGPLFTACGIAADRLVRHADPSENLRADLLLVPSGMRQSNRVSPLFADATRFWTQRIPRAPEIMPTPASRIFVVQRPGAGQAIGLANAEAIEAVVRRRGFAVVQPDTLPLADQAALFSHATLIAGEYSAALHASVFSPSGTITCCLRSPTRHPGFLQSGIAAALNQRTGYVFGRTEPAGQGSRFSIEPADFERALDVMEAGHF